MKTFPLGQWTPDAPDLATGGLTDCKGVYPSTGGYAPFWSAESASVSVSGTVMGSARFERGDGTEILCVGTSSDLYVIVGGTATASSLSLTGLDADECWRFEQFGAEVYATIKSGGSYYLTNINSDTTFSAATGTPPSGNALGRVDDFLIYGDLTDIDASDAPYRIRWSQFNNPSGTWGTDLATQSGFIDMPAAMGKVTGVSGGDVGIIFQKRGISRIDYVGGASAFAKVIISPSIGCEGPASVVDVKGVRYFLSTEGFAKTDGSGIEIISAGRVWDWFLENADTESLHLAQAAHNWDRRCVVWNFVNLGGTRWQIIYNWEQDRWSYATQNYLWLVPVTYDGSFGEGDPRLRRIIGGFASGTFYEFSGSPIAATLTTGEFEINPGGRAFVREIHPRIENVDSNSTVKVSYRNKPGGSWSTTSAVAVNNKGSVPFNVDARFIRVEIGIPAGADWDKAHSFVADFIPSGMS